MRVKLQRVMWNDEGDEETVTDVITLNKNNQRIEHLGLTLSEAKQLLSTTQRHLLRQQVDAFLNTRGLSGLRDTSASESPLSPLISHLVWHVSVRQSKAGALRLQTAQDLILSPPVGSADRVGGPGTPVYGSHVVLPGVLRHEPGCPQRLSPS